MEIDDVLTGKRVTRITEVLFEDGDVVGLHLTTASGEHVVLTDWTDWTLRVDRRADGRLPDYFWPPEDHSEKVLFEDGDGAEVTSARKDLDETGDLIGLRFALDGFGPVAVRADADGFSWRREDRPPA
ncbi:hypothetical protein [Streptomyces sp. NK15101]|uniref:hypothetical protein n=1 Tax=Streptomyces sp. NK15101 TaxID=2873261 RepID=UPI001CEC4459|nr:hypothetical protein [Streptomyces sp. NK15101]